MNRIDALKIGLLLTAIIVWFTGYKLRNGALMTTALSLMVVAFALRFFRTRPPGAPSS
jgi:hypothetical protein